MAIEVGQQYRIKENGLILTVKEITGNNVSCTILKNNQDMPGTLSLSMMTSIQTSKLMLQIPSFLARQTAALKQ